MISDRDTAITTALVRTRWAGWQAHGIAGDASARRYLRLSQGNDSVIVMDAPPDICTDTKQFLHIASILHKARLTAPELLWSDPEQGIFVLSDLGTDDFAAHLHQHPQDEMALYTAATALLVKLQSVTPPEGLIHLTPQKGAAMIDVLGQHYTCADIADVQVALEEALTRFAPVPDTLALRDFHAENLIWRAGHAGHDRIGLLDFQDAFIAPAGYDLASLLRDARRDIAPHTAAAAIDSFTAGAGPQAQDLRLQIAVLGVQRNLRILGVFARLAHTAGKTRYLSFMPRVWDHILTDLATPELAGLRAVVQSVVPPPSRRHLQGLVA